MAKKSTVVYTLDLLVHVEFDENVSFKDMQAVTKDIKEQIVGIKEITDYKPVFCVKTITIEKTIVQKKVTY